MGEGDTRLRGNDKVRVNQGFPNSGFGLSFVDDLCDFYGLSIALDRP